MSFSPTFDKEESARVNRTFATESGGEEITCDTLWLGPPREKPLRVKGPLGLRLCTRACGLDVQHWARDGFELMLYWNESSHHITGTLDGSWSVTWGCKLVQSKFCRKCQNFLWLTVKKDWSPHPLDVKLVAFGLFGANILLRMARFGLPIVFHSMKDLA